MMRYRDDNRRVLFMAIGPTSFEIGIGLWPESTEGRRDETTTPVETGLCNNKTGGVVGKGWVGGLQGRRRLMTGRSYHRGLLEGVQRRKSQAVRRQGVYSKGASDLFNERPLGYSG